MGLPRLGGGDAGAGRGRLLAAAASPAATTASARPVAVECLGGGRGLRRWSRRAARRTPASRSPRGAPGRRDPGPGRPLGAAARATRPRRRSRRARRRAASSPTSRAGGGGLRLPSRASTNPASRARGFGPGAGPGRRDPPLRSAADLGRDRLRRRRGSPAAARLLDAADLRDHYAVRRPTSGGEAAAAAGGWSAR